MVIAILQLPRPSFQSFGIEHGLDNVVHLLYDLFDLTITPELRQLYGLSLGPSRPRITESLPTRIRLS